MLAPYCHNRSNPTRQESYGGDPKSAGIVLPQLATAWSPRTAALAVIHNGQTLQGKSSTAETKSNAGIILPQTGAGTVLLQLGQALQGQHPNGAGTVLPQSIQPVNPNQPKPISTGD